MNTFKAATIQSSMRPPELIETARLVLRRPEHRDAQEIFSRYATDAEVTKYMGFRAHQSLDDTLAFLSTADAEWERWSTGPYLVRSRVDNQLLGATGLHFETLSRAMTGYVFAKDAWGKGYATETLRAMVDTARSAGVRRLYAICHTAHGPSRHVLEKCGFVCEGTLRAYMEFPNLDPGVPTDVFCYALIL